VALWIDSEEIERGLWGVATGRAAGGAVTEATWGDGGRRACGFVARGVWMIDGACRVVDEGLDEALFSRVFFVEPFCGTGRLDFADEEALGARFAFRAAFLLGLGAIRFLAFFAMVPPFGSCSGAEHTDSAVCTDGQAGVKCRARRVVRANRGGDRWV